MRGVYVGACSDVCLDGVRALDTKSAYGTARGLEIAGGSDNVQLQQSYVADVVAGACLDAPHATTYPNLKPEAVGIRVSQDTEFVGLGRFVLEGNLAQPGPAPATKLEFLCDSGEKRPCG